MDWFGPTGVVLREFGSKPASILLLVGGIYALINYRPTSRFEYYCDSIIKSLAIYLILYSILDYLIFSFYIDSNGYYKDSKIQFVFQLLIVISTLISIAGNIRIFYRIKDLRIIPKLILYSFLLHILAFLVQFFNILPYNNILFDSFHLIHESSIMRPTGLMTEPSYLGVLIAMFAGVLLLSLEYFTHKKLVTIVCFASLAIAYSIDAKSFLPTISFGLIAIWINPAKININIYIKFLILTSLCLGFFYVSTVLNVFNINANLSSAMRFGSTVLSINAALSGYGLFGIGVGQFHYVYLPQFAPDFLLNTDEAYQFFNSASEFRASTYNLFSRILIEFGVVNLALFLFILYRILKFDIGRNNLYIIYLFGCSIGFLFMQDTYSYPPLIVCIALLIALKAKKNV